MTEIIDLSAHNFRRGRVDWHRVKAAGISGVMLRIGWAGYAGEIFFDEMLAAETQAALDAGLDVGFYVYAYCKNPQAAVVAATQAVEFASRFHGQIRLPIAFDVEETQLPCLTEQGRAGLTDSVLAFCKEVERRGYYPIWYTYTSFLLSYLDRTRLAAYDLWIADYRGNDALFADRVGRYTMWQYRGETGSCDGVTGACDRNTCYVDYPERIAQAFRNGLVWNPETGGSISV